MADITLSTLIDTFLQEGALDATQKDSIREDLGLKTTDAVTFKNLILTGLSLTGSQTTSSIDIAATWNTSGVATALKLNITNTASNGSSRIFDFQVGGTSVFYLQRNGYALLGNNISGMNGPYLWLSGNDTAIVFNSSGGYAAGGQELYLFKNGLSTRSSFVYSWGGTYQCFPESGSLSRPSAWTYQFGTNHATTPTSQTIKAHDVTTGAGADLLLSGGSGSTRGGYVKSIVPFGFPEASFASRPDQPFLMYIITDSNVQTNGSQVSDTGPYKVLTINNSSGQPIAIVDVT